MRFDKEYKNHNLKGMTNAKWSNRYKRSHLDLNLNSRIGSPHWSISKHTY